MRMWQKTTASLAFACLSTPLFGQGIPGAPPAAGTVGGPSAFAAAPAAAAPQNLWAYLCMTPEQHEACRQKICNCALGKMLNSMLTPMSAMSGGLIEPICKENLAVGLAKNPETVGGAAARIKKDMAEAKQRIADIRYMAGVDCRYWPEAEAALTLALRADRVECVRYEAAVALTRGCCCTEKVIKALTFSVQCSDKDGSPKESSERVRAQASVALEKCLARCPDLGLVEEEKPVEVPKVKPKEVEAEKKEASQSDNARKQKEKMLADAKKALENRPATVSKSNKSLLELISSTGTPTTIPVTSRVADQNVGVASAYNPTNVGQPIQSAVSFQPANGQSNMILTSLPKAKDQSSENQGYYYVTVLQTSDSTSTRLDALEQISKTGLARLDLAQVVVNAACLDESPDVRLAAFKTLPVLQIPQEAITIVARRLKFDAVDTVRMGADEYLKAAGK